MPAGESRSTLASFLEPTSVVYDDRSASIWHAYGAALASVVVAAAARAVLDPVLGDRMPFLTFALAVLFAVIRFGRWPAVLTACAGFVVGSWYFVDPRRTVAPSDAANVLRDVFYFIVTLGGIEVVERMRVFHRGAASAEHARRALSASEERFRAIAEAVPQILFTTRPDGKADYINRRLYEMTGASPDGDRRDLLAYVHPDDAALVWARWRAAVEQGQPFDTEYRIRRSDGEYRWFKTRGVPVRDTSGAIVQWVGSAMEIEDRKRAEAELTSALELMARARDHAEAANRAKDQFLAVLSHELRSPLSAMVGWLWALRREVGHLPTATRAVETLERNVRAQSQLIEELLDVSRIVSGKLRLEFAPTDMDSVVRGAVDAMRPTVAGKSLTLTYEGADGSLVVDGDSDRLGQVVRNLLANAIKFTPEGGRITVTLARADATAVCTVADTGEGIPASFLPHVFDRFRQADASLTREHGGLGLGLAIVRHVVGRHGGRVTAASAGVNLGATFTVTLPLAPAVTVATRPAAVPAGRDLTARLDALRVLLVDDEPDTRAAMSLALEADGARVIQAGSVREALAEYERGRPEVIVSDLSMPGEDGYALIRVVRERQGRTTPALAVTGLASARDRERALHAGFDSYLAKPVQPDILIETVRMLVSSRRAAG